MTREQFIRDLSAGAEAMGVLLTEPALKRFFLYYTELQRWNRKVNLVSRKQHDWVSIHFLDSLSCLGLGLLGQEGRIVDLGSGAGFPGLPLKIARDDLFVGMAEASRKKCTWLRHLTRILELDKVSIMEGRFKELVEGGWAGQFDVAVSRAAAKPGKILDIARPFIAGGGRVLIYTTEALVKKGQGRVHPYRVPGSNVPSVIWEVGV
jgi:16S rRNA (guanine527-N7)-methyltransferase